MFSTAAQCGLAAGVALYVACFALAFVLMPYIPGLKKYYLALPPGGRADWDSRVPSTVHSIVVVLGIYFPALLHPQHTELRVLYWDDRLYVPYGLTGLGPSFWMAFFVGYLITDVPVLLLHWHEIDMPAITLFHHGLCATCYTLGLQKHTMQWYGCFWLLAELSTPFANLRWWLAKCQVETTSNLYLFVGSWLFVTFFMVRVLPQAIVPALIYSDMTEIIRHNGSMVFFWFVVALLGNALLQCYWWSLMLRAILRKFFGIGAPSGVHEESIDTESQQAEQLESPNSACRQRHVPHQEQSRPATGGGTGGWEPDFESPDQDLSI